MSLFEPPMRVRVRHHLNTPMGMWGKAGEIISVDYLSIPSGEITDPPEQVYTVLFDGESKPMKVFESWLGQDFGF